MKQENLFVTDLDGTLFHSNVTVSEYTTMTINKLINAGYYITFCTARSYYMARKIMNKTKFGMTESKANISGDPEIPIISLACSNWAGFVDSVDSALRYKGTNAMIPSKR